VGGTLKSLELLLLGKEEMVARKWPDGHCFEEDRRRNDEEMS